jgi:glycosyltransferase involved in cell wall biosynthesis
LRDFVGRTQFLQAVKNSTFVVVPSFYEASPMFLLESMCMGKVPLLFDLPYAREFTQEGRYGVLAKNVHDMASKINQIYRQGNMELLEKEIKDFARARYDIRRTASEYYDLYREICERAR